MFHFQLQPEFPAVTAHFLPPDERRAGERRQREALAIAKRLASASRSKWSDAAVAAMWWNK